MIKRFDTEISYITHSGRDIIKIYHEDKVYYAWYILSSSVKEEINTKFGSIDGPKVINAAQQYIKSLGEEKGSNLLQFINEDPMMVCSLGLEVPGVDMPIRWLVGDGASYIATPLCIKADTSIIGAKYKIINTAYSGSKTALIGARVDFVQDALGIAFGAWSPIGKWYIAYNTTANGERSYALNNDIHIVELRANKLYQDEVFLQSYGSIASFTSRPIDVFAQNVWDHGIKLDSFVHIAEVYIGDDTIGTHTLIPCHDKTQGNGMLDLVNVVFYPNAGTGQFTIPDIVYPIP